MISHLLKNKKEVSQLYEKPKKIKFGHAIYQKNWCHEIDVLYLPDDSNKSNHYKYCFVIIDCSDKPYVDARMMIDNSSKMCLAALEDIYEKSPYLSEPKIIKGDGQFNNKIFKNNVVGHLCEKLIITQSENHRQLAHINRWCRTLGDWILRLQIDKEIDTKMPNTEWRSVLKTLVKIKNQHVAGMKEKPIKKCEPEFGDKKTPLIMVGTNVRTVIDKDQPIDYFGNRIHGKIRSADIKFNPEVFRIHSIFINCNGPPMYKLIDENGAKLNKLWHFEELQII